MTLTITDIFAGAGGSSTGAASVPGVHVALAANHWKLAVDVHNANHPDTDHACVDLHLEDPRNFPRTDMLWASPECTKWSIANSKAKALSVEMGGDPTLFDAVPVELESTDDDEISRSRLLMFDVLRFIEYHRYRYVVVENVLDIATQPKYAAAWHAWRNGLRKLGYDYRVVSLNSMHAQLAGPPAPQSRDRLYIVAWPQGEKAPDLDRALRPWAWCDRCETAVESRQAWKPGRSVGRYRAQYVYACGRCGKAVEPGWLPASTAIDWTLPAERIGDRKRPLSEKTMARIREGLRRYGTPHLTQFRERVRAMDPCAKPLPTIVADGANHGLVLDAIRSAPIISSTDEPLRTQTTAYTRSLLIPVEGRDGKAAASVDQPMRTQTTRNETGLLVPYYSASKGLVLDNNHHNRVRESAEPLPTLTTATTKALLVPSGGTWHEDAYPTRAPLRTVTTRENHGLLVPYYSASETAKPTSEPIGTLTTVDRYALVTLRGTNAPKPVAAPLDTVAASGNHHGLMSVTEEDVMACRFRMLEPSEIAVGMAFPRDYRWRGTKRERVRLAGNAVTPPAARDLITVLAESLGVSA